MGNRKLQNYYDILEVAPDAPQHEVHQAYQRAKSTYASDSPALYTMFTPEEAKELLALVEEAFAVLGNHNRRMEYDQQIIKRATSSHKVEEALPEFEGPLDENVSEKSTFDDIPFGHRSGKKTEGSPIPEGFEKTRFGVYEVNQELEDEISSEEEFTGEFLRKVRNYKKINLDQMSNETRISRTYIAAIESDDFAALPAPVFVRGFVVQISKVLGIQTEKAASNYMKRYKQSCRN